MFFDITVLIYKVITMDYQWKLFVSVKRGIYCNKYFGLQHKKEIENIVSKAFQDDVNQEG